MNIQHNVDSCEEVMNTLIIIATWRKKKVLCSNLYPLAPHSPPPPRHIGTPTHTYYSHSPYMEKLKENPLVMNLSMVLANMFNALIPIILQIIPSLATLHGKVGGLTNPFLLVKKI
jgi:hypothetical protein